MVAINRYQQLVDAGRSLTGTDIFQRIDKLSKAEMNAFLESNAAMLEAARQALGGEFRTQISFDAGFVDEQCWAIGALRDLARAFAVEFSSAERRGENSRAIAVGVDMLALANAVRRGGLVLNCLVAIAFEDIGLERLRSLRRKLNSAESIDLADGILKYDAAREPFNDIVARDLEWDRNVVYPESDVAGVRCDQSNAIDTAILGDADIDPDVEQLLRAAREMPIEQLRVMERNQDDRGIALCRMLAIEAALNAHRATCGGYPADLNVLAPKFVADIPADPFTGESFKYRIAGEAYCLYSPGPTRRDHGGTFGNWLEVQAGAADLCLDVSDYGLSCAIGSRRPGLVSRIVSRVRRVLAR